MRFYRDLSDSRSRHEEVILFVSVYCAAAAALWVRLGLPTPSCPFHELTGIPCLTCGVTRAIYALLSFDLSGAFCLNPLFVIVLALISLYDLYAIAVLAGFPRLSLEISRREGTACRVICVFAIVSNWGWLLVSQT